MLPTYGMKDALHLNWALVSASFLHVLLPQKLGRFDLFSSRYETLLWFLGASEISFASNRQAQLSAGPGRCSDGGGEERSDLSVVVQGVEFEFKFAIVLIHR